jgi:putative DNA primase/helicase
MTNIFIVRNGQTGERKTVNAEQIGMGPEWQAPCPFHPSDGLKLKLKLNTEKRVWHCVVCPASGEVVDAEENDSDSPSKRSSAETGIDWQNRVREHLYRSETGKPLLKIEVYRGKNNVKTKACILYAWINGGWEKGLTKKDEQGQSIPHLYKVPLVPYHLDKITNRLDLPVFIHEGEKDCDTMDELSQGEMIGTTNAMGAGKWKNEYSEYLQGRDVFLIPDNDKPGYDHMRQVGESVRKVARSVKVIFLPGLADNDSKDFTDWLDDGHTLEEFRQLVKQAPDFDSKLLSKYDPDNRIEKIDFEDIGPSKIKTDISGTQGKVTGDQLAGFILEDKFTQDGFITMKYHGGAFSVYDGTYYRTYDPKAFRSIIDTYLREELPEQRGITTAISSNLKEEIIKSLQDRQNVFLDSEIKLPYWQGGNPSVEGEVLVMKNGILTLDKSLAEGTDQTTDVLIPHTPRLFATFSLPYDYDPNAQCPKWIKFLNETFSDDPESIAFIQEWFGYHLSSENNQKAFLVLEGPTNSGKSVITNILTAMMGEQNVSNIPLIDFKHDFKLQGIYGKKANICAEIKSTGAGCEQMLKSITGGDRIELDVKFQSPRSFLPTVKITFTTNEHPHWDDKSGALYTRLKVIKCEHSVPEENQNKRLTNELREELAGILNWSIEGLKRLQAHNTFTVSQKSRDAVNQQRNDSDSAWGFASDCLVPNPDSCIKLDILYDRYKTWTANEGFRSPLKKGKFCDVVLEKFHDAKKRRLGPADSDRPFYLDGIAFINPLPDKQSNEDHMILECFAQAVDN